MMTHLRFHGILLVAFLASAIAAGAPVELDQYNVVWTEQSHNASESMPVGGHDIGLNVWVENGDVLFYMQRSGSLSENGEYLKLGRIRIRMNPNPLKECTSFRQELKLSESTVEIEGRGTDQGKSIHGS